MIPIYIVSMKKDIERRAVIAEKFKQLAINFQFIDAVVGSLLPESEIKRLNVSANVARKGRAPTPGEIGCSLSHQVIYQDIVNKQHDWAIILEDDAIIDDRFKDFYLEMNQLEKRQQLEGNNLYLLGGQDGLRYRSRVVLSVWGKLKIGKAIFRRAVNSNEYIYRTCCYLMSKEMAKRLIELFEKEYYIADEWAYFARLGIINNIYLANFVSHPLDLENSSIQQERELANLIKESNGKTEKQSLPKIKYLMKKYLKAHYIKNALIKIKLSLLALQIR